MVHYTDYLVILISYMLRYPELREILPAFLYERRTETPIVIPNREYDEELDSVMKVGIKDEQIGKRNVLWMVASVLVVCPLDNSALVENAFKETSSLMWPELDEVYASFRKLYEMNWWMKKGTEDVQRKTAPRKGVYFGWDITKIDSDYWKSLFWDILTMESDLIQDCIAEWYNKSVFLSSKDPVGSLIAFLQSEDQSTVLAPWDELTGRLQNNVEFVSDSWCGQTFVAIIKRGFGFYDELNHLKYPNFHDKFLDKYCYAYFLVFGDATTKKLTSCLIDTSGNVTLQRAKKKMKIDGKPTWVRKNYFLACFDSGNYVFSATGKYIGYSSERIDCTREIKMDIIKDCFLPVIKLKSDGDEWDRVFLTEAGELLPGEE